MLFHNDPFFDSFFERTGGRSRHRPMPLDAYRRGEDVWVHVDLPGVSADSLDINVERDVLTIEASRGWATEDGDRLYLSERPQGTYRRQVHLGDGLDAEKIEADFTDGVLTLRIPVAERAKPRKISITPGGGAAIEAESSPA